MKKCLIVVDYQNDFVTGSLGFPKAVELEEPIVQKIKQYRNHNGVIVFTYDTHGDNYLNTLEGQNLPVVHCINDTEGHQLYGQVAELALPSDIHFHKPTFGSSDLFEFLKSNQYESIELVGLVSNICVLANAILAKTASPETPIVVDANCTASFDNRLHEACLVVMEGLQIKVIR